MYFDWITLDYLPYLLLTAFISFWIIRWALGLAFGAVKWRSIASAIIALVLASVTMRFIFGLGLFLLLIECEDKRPFDLQSWKEEPNDRFEMMEDLVASNAIRGLDSSELKLKLGEPIDIKATKDGTTSWVYPLGSSSHGFGIKFHYLQVEIRSDTVSALSSSSVVD